MLRTALSQQRLDHYTAQCKYDVVIERELKMDSLCKFCYNNYMTTGDYVRKRKHLFWSTKNYDGLSKAAIVEGVLNYGNWDDVKAMIKMMGMEEVASIFRRNSIPSKMGRQNYRPEIVRYFNLFFNEHVHQNA